MCDIIRSCDPELGENIKWNAPSYGFGDDHRITLRTAPGRTLSIILHRGAKKRGDDKFHDASGMVNWVGPDRGIVDFEDLADIEAHRGELVHLCRAWLAATKDISPAGL